MWDALSDKLRACFIAKIKVLFKAILVLFDLIAYNYLFTIHLFSAAIAMR